MDQDHYQCAGCQRYRTRSEFHEFRSNDRNRPVTSRCKECRREDYYRRKYPDTVCAACMKHRALDRNLMCRDCNEETGLRACRSDKYHIKGELLPVFLKFYGRSRVCKDCQKATKKELETEQRAEPLP